MISFEEEGIILPYVCAVFSFSVSYSWCMILLYLWGRNHGRKSCCDYISIVASEKRVLCVCKLSPTVYDFTAGHELFAFKCFSEYQFLFLF